MPSEGSLVRRVLPRAADTLANYDRLMREKYGHAVDCEWPRNICTCGQLTEKWSRD